MSRQDHFGVMRLDGPDSSSSFFRSDDPNSSSSPYFQEEEDDDCDEEDLQHISIPVCVLGPEILQIFRSTNPHWRPRDSARNLPESSRKHKKNCPTCLRAIQQGNPLLFEMPHALQNYSVERLSFGKHPSSHITDNAFQSTENSFMIKPSQLRSMKATPMDVSSETSLMKAPLLRAKTQVTEHRVISDNSASPCIVQQPITLNAREEYAITRTTSPTQQHIMKKVPERIHESPRFKNSGLALIQAQANEASIPDNMVTSSEEASEDTMARSRIDAHTTMKPGAGGSIKPSKSYVTNSSLKFDDQILIDNQAMFDYIVATRKLPDGISLATIDERMQKKLLCHYKSYCPPCPHCNSNAFVKFRYFNNSSKSTLLQPRYSCKNPETCLTVQEKTGKPGSRDFTLQRPKDADSYEGGQDISPSFVAKDAHANDLQEKTEGVRQPQMIARIGSKRAHHDLSSGAVTSNQIAKLPSTTLSLQSLTGSGAVIHTSGNHSSRIADSFKARCLLEAPKAIEDSNSSSSTTQTASEDKLGRDVKCSSENGGGRLIVQPISVQSVTPMESSLVDRSKGKIAEVNIRMFIDLSNTSPC